MSGPGDLLRSSCFKAQWTSFTSIGVKLNGCTIELIWSGEEGAFSSLGCFGSGCEDSNKEPGETKCSLKELRIAYLSESFAIQAGNSFVVRFQNEEFIPFQNSLGLFKLVLV